MSDIDDMLKGSSDQNPASQAQNQGQGSESGEGKPTGEQTPEEIEFSKLSGTAQERIRKLVNRATTAEKKITDYEAASRNYIPPAPVNYQSPDNQAAIDALEKAGITTDRKMDAKLNERMNQVLWNFEQSRLESRYSGANGEPKYDRAEVEDFIRNNPQYGGYSAEDVFRLKMFPDEFLNLEIKTRTGLAPKTGGSSTLRPTKATVTEETLTPEYINDRMDVKKYGRETVERFYNDNHDKIEAVLKNMVPPPEV